MRQEQIYKPRPRKKCQRHDETGQLDEPGPEPRDLADPGLAESTDRLLAEIDETLEEVSPS